MSPALADRVKLHVSAATRERLVILHYVRREFHSAELTVSQWPTITRRRSTPSSARRSSCAKPMGHRAAWVVMVTPVFLWARAAARKTRFLLSREPLVARDLTDDPRPDTGVGDTNGEVAHDPLSHGVGARTVDPRRFEVLVAVQAGPQHNVDLDLLADRSERQRVSSEAGVGHVDHRAPRPDGNGPAHGRPARRRSGARHPETRAAG